MRVTGPNKTAQECDSVSYSACAKTSASSGDFRSEGLAGSLLIGANWL